MRMENQPLVSIVINNFNYGQYLREAIESALNQTYPNVEVIVVDDGSTDSSRDVIEEYALLGKVVPVYKENGGQASAFNAGFRVSRGQVVLFLDADDVLLPHALARVVAAWRPGITKVQGRMEVVDATLKPLGYTYPPKDIPLPSGSVRDLLLRWRMYPSPPTSGNAFSRDFLSTVLPMPEECWRISADSYLLTLAGLRGPILSVEEPLALYRVHGKNAWATLSLVKERLEREIQIEECQKRLIWEEATQMGWNPRYPFGHAHGYKVEALAKALGSGLVQTSYARLALDGLVASLTWPHLSWRKRLRQSVFFLLLLLLPHRLRARWLIWGLDVVGRPFWLKRLVRWAGGGS